MAIYSKSPFALSVAATAAESKGLDTRSDSWLLTSLVLLFLENVGRAASEVEGSARPGFFSA